MDSEQRNVGGKRPRMDSESQPSVIFSQMESLQHSQESLLQQASSDMEIEVVSHSVDVDSNSGDRKSLVDVCEGDQPTCCVEGAEANILPTLCDSIELPPENKRHETKTLDDTSDIDSLIHLEPAKISVKNLRVVVPRMRVVCYSKEEEICGKKKMKNLWNDRPEDWPMHIPFRDPNNKGPDGRKATKEDLSLMFDFLRSKYQLMPRHSFDEVWGLENSQSENADIPMVKEELSPEKLSQDSPPPSFEMPFRSLLERCEDKANRLLVNVNDGETVDLVKHVFDDILVPLFKGSNQMATGCEFLDAGHQLETLLDVSLAYGKETVDVLKQGCQELLDKFFPARDAGTQSVTPHTVQMYTVQNPQPNPVSLAPATGNHWGLNLRPNVSYDLLQQSIESRPEEPANVPSNTDKDDLLKMAVCESGIKEEAVPGHKDLWDEILDLVDGPQSQQESVSVDQSAFEAMEVVAVAPGNQYNSEPFSYQAFLYNDNENITFNMPEESQQQQPPSMILGPCSPPFSPQGSIPTTVEDMTEEMK